MKKIRLPLIKQAIIKAQSNLRQSNSNTKTRAEVSGGGKKPWRQKGTGRARAGSSRSPIWSGGGITFGPRKERNFKNKLPKKMSQLAMKEMLLLLKEKNQLLLLDSLKLKEPKTKLALGLLKKHNIQEKKVLFVTKEIEPELIMACRNLPTVKTTFIGELGILALASSDIIVLEKPLLGQLGLEETNPKEKPAKKVNKRNLKNVQNN